MNSYIISSARLSKITKIATYSKIFGDAFDWGIHGDAIVFKLPDTREIVKYLGNSEQGIHKILVDEQWVNIIWERSATLRNAKIQIRCAIKLPD